MGLTEIYTELTDYLKCAHANKFTLFGYIGTITSLSLLSTEFGGILNNLNNIMKFGFKDNYFVSLDCILLGFSVGAIFLTGLGFATLQGYQETKEHIEKFGRLDDRFREKISKTYCVRVGMELASEEKRIEYIVQQAENETQNNKTGS